jgi:uroporphyrinogen decarboxylase
MRKIDKIALVDAVLSGADAERVPFSVWHHFPPGACSGKACADAHVAHYRKYDLDFLKVMNDNRFDMPVSMPVIERAKDWLSLKALRGSEPGFRAMLEALHEVKRAVGAETRFIATVYSPFAVAMRVSRDRAVEHLREDPESFEEGLAALAQGLSAFAKNAVAAGASGIFFAASGAEPTMLSEQEYRRFVKPQDLKVLKAVEDAPFNMLHVHGTSVHFELFLDYPVAVLNWPSHQSAWSIGRVREMTDRCIAAGIDERGPLAQGRMRGTISQIDEAVEQAGRTKFMVACECSIPPQTPADFLTSIRDLVAQM